MSNCPVCGRPATEGLASFNPGSWHLHCQLEKSVECLAVATVRYQAYEEGARDAFRTTASDAGFKIVELQMNTYKARLGKP